MATVTIDEYHLLHRENYDGWCTTCRDWTATGGIEPDARPEAGEYPCPECDQDTLYGAEEALMNEFFEVDDGLQKEKSSQGGGNLQGSW